MLSSRRLLTWNIFFSASSFERKDELNWSSFRDLIALIDSVCLFDQLVVLGETGGRPFLTHDSSFFDALRESGAVCVEGVDNDEQALIADVAVKHMSLFFGEQNVDKFGEWLAEALALNLIPAEGEQRATMNRAVRQRQPSLLRQPEREVIVDYLIERQGNKALRTFVTRAFMYYAYSEVERLPFVPDVLRAPLLEAVVGHEQGLMERLKRTIQAQWSEYPRFGNGGLRRITSPFAAIVFERAGRSRERIPQEMVRVRAELNKVRERIGELEATILYGSRDESLAAEEKWNGVLEEVERTFGPSSHRAVLRQGIEVMVDVASAVEIADAMSAWVRTFASHGALEALRWWDRRPVIHLHRLAKELPAPGRLQQAVEALFPELT